VKWKYVGQRKNLFGKWCYPGDVVENETQPPGEWVPLKKGNPKPKKNVVKEQVDEDNNYDNAVAEYRKELSKKKMNELREVGYKYGAKDTSKKELIDEIIEEKINRGEL
jgi:hypothetical protein